MSQDLPNGNGGSSHLRKKRVAEISIASGRGVAASRLAIITPWFGEDLKGGAEQLAWQLATRLGKAGHQVDVLTTTCRSFLTNWSLDYYRPGVYHEPHFSVQRFPLDSRDAAAFDRVNARMLSIASKKLEAGIPPVPGADAETFFRENINSTSLVEYLRRQTTSYDAFVFLPYLYGVVVNGIAACDPNRVFLQPCLHDEVYAYLPQVAEMIYRAGHLFFNSEGEMDLAMRLYGPGIAVKGSVVGLGVEIELGDADHLSLPRGLADKPFVLYLGRRDPTKNVEMLISAYRLHRASHLDCNLRLVLAGPGDSNYDDTAQGVYDLGLVENKTKDTLLRACRCLFQPSKNESFSRVMMEAWTAGRPVAAHSMCSATALAVREARGGFLASSNSEWSSLFETVETADAEFLSSKGTAGRLYVEQNLTWGRVIERYSEKLEQSRLSRFRRDRPRRPFAIHQMLPNLDCGDAISNQALAIRSYLRAEGYDSDIIVRYVDSRLSGEVKIFPFHELAPNSGLIYHHSTGSELTAAASTHNGPKCLIYHNITPSEFFEGFDDRIANRMSQGRAQLAETARHFDFTLGDSPYNAAELVHLGLPSTEVLPIIVEPTRWELRPDSATLSRLRDGRTNLLFVGRLAPNKAQHDLVSAFALYRTMDPGSRLILAGRFDPDSPYYIALREKIEQLGISRSVEIAGHASESELMAYYLTAHLFWSMSEHEGFGVPLIEAMWFGIPVLAYRSSAVPETLGSAGVMFTDKKNMLHVAGLARVLVNDAALRDRIVAGQKRRRRDFRLIALEDRLQAMAGRLESALHQKAQ